MPPKGPGKPGKRPLVVAPLEDRIVQRAILDVLQSAKELSAIQRVLQTPTSIGGIPGRGVDHAIKLFDERVKAGDKFVAGSDISGFFTKIPKDTVFAFLETAGVESEFIELVKSAFTVELINGSSLSEEDRKLFPIGNDGVAQGCPLSSLAGNIVLESFDKEMNSRGITCIRYIDDFIVMGRSAKAIAKAMQAAKAALATLNMDIYDPALAPQKAFIGQISDGHTFLGYRLVPGSYPPAAAAVDQLIGRVQKLISGGQKAISKAVTDRPLTNQDRCYAQTLVAIDHTVRGWRGSFALSACPDVFEKLDRDIDRKIADFRAFYLAKLKNRSAAQQRRAIRVSLLSQKE